MVHNNNSSDSIIADYVYRFLKREFGEKLPITVSAYNLKEKQAIIKVRSFVIDNLTTLYYHLEEEYPITKDLKIQSLKTELIVVTSN